MKQPAQSRSLEQSMTIAKINLYCIIKSYFNYYSFISLKSQSCFFKNTLELKLSFYFSRLKLIEYFKSKITTHGILFLQDTHSSSEDKQKWRDNFSGNIFFSQGKGNSCGVLISYIETSNFFVNNKKTDNDGQILILDVTINDADFVLINLYHANTEMEQVSVLNNLSSLLPNFDVSLEKKSILAGDFNLFLKSKLDAKGEKPVTKQKKSLSKTYFYTNAFFYLHVFKIITL